MGFRKKFGEWKSFLDKKSSHRDSVNTLRFTNESVGDVLDITGSSLAVPVQTSTMNSIDSESGDSLEDISQNKQSSERIEIARSIHYGETYIQAISNTNKKQACDYGGGNTVGTVGAEINADTKTPIYERTTEGIEARNLRPTSSGNSAFGSNLTNTNGNENQGVPEKVGVSAIAMFNGPQLINGGTFIQNIVKSDRRGFKLLQERVATSAFHNSARRVDPPRCHPNTRVAIQKRIFDWISMDLVVRKAWIMWIQGAAGAGKSAIIQSVAELCEKAQIPLATFFFFRTDDTRNSMTTLIATLVYQLIQNIPRAQDEIFGIIESNPLIFDQSLEYQLQKLIIQPLLQLQADFKCFLVIMIDGLDECIDRIQQAYLINLLATMSRSKTIPVVFLVASRREPQIEAAFVRKGVSDLVWILPLDNSDIQQTSGDIRRFLVDKLDDIRDTHLFKDHLPVDWAASAIEEIVAKSSGQFIFASVVINYLSSPRANPAVRLEVIRGIRVRDPSSQNPFVYLDALYEQIFSQVEELGKVLDILGYVLSGGFNDISHIQRVFLLEAGGVDVLFADLVGVIYCGSYHSALRFLHASLPDFLLDKSRSERYHIDLDEYRTKLLCEFLERPPPIVNPLWSADNLKHTIDRERRRLHAIGRLLTEVKASERLRSALMRFNSTFCTKIFLGIGWHVTGSDILKYAKQLDFDDQGEAYRHVVEMFAAEYAKYWPLLDDCTKKELRCGSPDLVDRIDWIQEGNTISY